MRIRSSGETPANNTLELTPHVAPLRVSQLSYDVGRRFRYWRVSVGSLDQNHVVPSIGPAVVRSVLLPCRPNMSTRDPQLQLTLELRDLILINNALNEILNGPAAIDSAEFHARTGATIEDAELLLSRVARAIELRSTQ